MNVQENKTKERFAPYVNIRVFIVYVSFSNFDAPIRCGLGHDLIKNTDF